jgi:hypothetical protein
MSETSEASSFASFHHVLATLSPGTHILQSLYLSRFIGSAVLFSFCHLPSSFSAMDSFLLVLAVAGCVNGAAPDHRQATPTVTVTVTGASSTIPQYFQTTPELFASPSQPPPAHKHYVLSEARYNRDWNSALSRRNQPRAFRHRELVCTQSAT